MFVPSKILYVSFVSLLLVFFQNFKPYKRTLPVIEKSVSYETGGLCTDRTEKCLDVVYSAEERRPLVVFVHGGGWKSGTYKNHINQLGETFFKEGYAFASIGYRLYPTDADGKPNHIQGMTLRDIASDVSEGISFLQNNKERFNHNNSIIIMGHSAGAHLAALAVTHPDILEDKKKIRGVILLDGHVYSFKSLEGKYNGLLQHATKDPNNWRDLSPVDQVKHVKNLPPFLIVSDIERFVPVEGGYPGTGLQAKLLRKELSKNKVPVVHQKFDNKPHGGFLHDVNKKGDKLQRAVFRFANSVQARHMVSAKDHKLKDLEVSKLFDWKVYYAKNLDLQEDFSSKEDLLRHWREKGAKAGRVSHSDFSVKKFMEKYPRIKSFFDKDYLAASIYYARHARKVGYRARHEQDELYGAVLPNDNTLAPFGNTIIGNDRIRVLTSAKYAGAVTELWYRGTQIVNSGAKGYGRLFQIAGWKFGMGASYNPIEAGGRYLEPDLGDYTKTVIHHLDVSNGYFENLITPSLFRKRGEDENLCKESKTGEGFPLFGQALDRDIRFGKKIQLNAFGNPNIIKFSVLIDSKINMSDFIFQLYAALRKDMSQVYTLDLDICKGRAGLKGACNLYNREEVMGSARKYSTKFPAILARKDQSIAFTLYSPERVLGKKASYSAELRRGEGEQGTADTAVSFNVGAVEEGVIDVPIYVFVGSLERVKRDLERVVLMR